jgi:hypothetical protein
MATVAATMMNENGHRGLTQIQERTVIFEGWAFASDSQFEGCLKMIYVAARDRYYNKGAG